MMYIYGHGNYIFWSQMLFSVIIRGSVAYKSAWDQFLPDELWHWPSLLWSTMRYNSSQAEDTWTVGYAGTVAIAVFYNAIWLVGWFLYQNVAGYHILKDKEF